LEKKTLRSNQGIRAQEVRLIDEHGVMLGIVSLREAQEMAHMKELDLIEISPETHPPVCKIMDYGRMRYHEQKKKMEMKKKQKTSVLKEIQLRPHIQEHDYQVKLNNAKGFLEDGDKVKITLQFRGREISFAETGKSIVERMIVDLAEVGKVESNPKLEGRRMICVIIPVKSGQASAVKSAAPVNQNPT
jgi:translation initiation factor IF-3